MEKQKIKSFTDLNAWKEAHKFVLEIYKITQQFPEYKKFGLTNQIRRAGVSISSNIAEGFSRKSSLEKRQFYYHTLGSLTETQNQLIIARDLKCIKGVDFRTLADQSIIVSKLINGLIKSVNSKHNT